MESQLGLVYGETAALRRSAVRSSAP